MTMTMKRTPRPRDPVQLGKLMVDIMTGQMSDAVDNGKDAGAAAMGRKGGRSRASNLSSDERKATATKAANARWASRLKP